MKSIRHCPSKPLTTRVRRAAFSLSYAAIDSGIIDSRSVRRRGRLAGELSTSSALLGEQQVQAAVCQFFCDAVCFQALAEVAEVHAVHLLVLVEAGEDDFRRGLRLGVNVLLQALAADFFHHALHHRVDRCDADMVGLQIGFQDRVPRLGNGSHHAV